jgi:hypothetical protein
MQTETPTSAPARTRYAGPIWTLVLLAPLIAEVLSGSTRLSFIFVYIPEVMVWGCGALLCRELVRRWRAGATSLLLLGLALSVAEEFVIQQTSLAPLPFPGSNASYGRFCGVNWLYLLFMLGYESVWVTVVPVTITELLFPLRRSQPWLRKVGAIVACAVFLFGSFIAWLSWTQFARPSLHAAVYRPPFVAIASGVAAILLLIGLAYLLRCVDGEMGSVATRAPGTLVTWTAGIAAFALGAVWFKLIAMLFMPVRTPVWIPLTAGFAGAVCSYALFRALSSSAWGDMPRWSVSFGAVMACMSVSYLNTAGWSRVDLIGKAILNVLALITLLWIGIAVHRRITPKQES